MFIIDAVIPYAGETVYVTGAPDPHYERTAKGVWYYYIGSETFSVDDEDLIYALETAYQEYLHAHA